MLLILLCLALPGVNLEGAKNYQTLQPCWVSQEVALSPAFPSVSAHSSHHSLCKISPVSGGSNSRHDKSHWEQDLALGKLGPICSSSQPGCFLGARHSRDCGSRACRLRSGGKNSQGNDLFDLVFCTSLALKRAQLSLRLSTSASNYVKENIIVLLTLLLALSSRAQ